jgi:4-hydroxybenzoate polyprenyltransferase
MKSIIKLLRPQQYLKNTFLFAPLFFSFQYSIANIVTTIIAFVLFSMLASSIYIFNDFMDIEDDKTHPTNCCRPIASGEVNWQYALLVMFCLSIVSLTIAFFISVSFFQVLLIYFVLNLGYSIKLKHIAVVDILIIAIGFVLRLLAGGEIINIELSEWIMVMTFLLSLLLALAKRRDDILLAANGITKRKNIDGYNLKVVNAIMYLLSGIMIIGYFLFSISEQVVPRLGSDYLYFSTIFVIWGIRRYLKIVFIEKQSGNPTEIVLSDKTIQMSILLWLLSFQLIKQFG